MNVDGTKEGFFGFEGFWIRRMVGLNCRAIFSESAFGEMYLMFLLVVLVLCCWVEEPLQEMVLVVEEGHLLEAVVWRGLLHRELQTLRVSVME